MRKITLTYPIPHTHYVMVSLYGAYQHVQQVYQSILVPLCTTPTDIVFRSSDGHQFGGHKHHLDLFPSFLQPGITTLGFPQNDEPVDMTESTVVLSTLLHFMHPSHKQPDIKIFGVDAVLSLAEASRKYRVYTAIQLCKLRMEYVSIHSCSV